jgi:SAM-dependent methyltransferase
MENHGSNSNLIVLQADLYRLPLAPESFDYVYCLGVLQHTPDVRAAFFSLIRYIRPGGQITIDVYPKLLRNLLWCKYWLRPITKRMPAEQLFRVVGWMTPVLLRMSDALRRVPVAGRHLRYALPVVNYRGVYPLSEVQLREWAVLDTFDMLSPAHDHPQSIQTVERWLREAGLEDRFVKRIGFNIGRGRKPQAVEQVSCAS